MARNTTYVAISRMSALTRQMEVVANNIANISTPGYKSEHLMFTEYLSDANREDKVAFVNDIKMFRDSTTGPLVPTEKPLDVAINGNGMFMVDTPQGERYTRVGRFSLGQDGQLVTANGDLVLDRFRNPIFLPPESKSIEITEAGEIIVDDASNAILGVMDFDNQAELKKIGSSLYEYVGPEERLPKPDVPQGTKLLQGKSEESNVSGVVEMTRMIGVHRSYEATSRMLENEDQRIRDTIRKVAEVV